MQNVQAVASQPVTATVQGMSCPACRQPMLSDPSFAGQVVACPHCTRQFVMPGSAVTVVPPIAVSSSAVPVASIANRVRKPAQIVFGAGCLGMLALCVGFCAGIGSDADRWDVPHP